MNKVIVILSDGDMNVCSNFHVSAFNICRDVTNFYLMVALDQKSADDLIQRDSFSGRLYINYHCDSSNDPKNCCCTFVFALSSDKTFI